MFFSKKPQSIPFYLIKRFLHECVMTSEDAERASAANSHAHINDQRLLADMKVKWYLLWYFLPRSEAKIATFRAKSSVFVFLHNVARVPPTVASWEKPNGPVECVQSAGCSQMGAVCPGSVSGRIFHMFPRSSDKMCFLPEEKKNTKN